MWYYSYEDVISNININTGNKPLIISDALKSLGVQIDWDLRFRSHLRSIFGKAFAALKIIYANRSFLDVNTRKMPCDCLVLYHFN